MVPVLSPKPVSRMRRQELVRRGPLPESDRVVTVSAMARPRMSDLAHAPIEEIEARLARVRAERHRLETEERMLTELLGARRSAPGAAPSGRSEGGQSAGEAGPGQRETVTARVLLVVRQAGGQSVSPAQVHAQLIKRGFSTSLDNVRRALRRWVERGALGKADDGYFDLRPQSRPGFEIPDAMRHDR